MVSPLVLLSFLFGIVSHSHALESVEPYTNKVIYSPPRDYRVPRTLYARSLLIAEDGDDKNVLLATWENYSPEPPLVWFPIYRSTDLGQTWTPISNVTDDVNGWGMRYQPFLYELKEDIGNYPVRSCYSYSIRIPDSFGRRELS